MLARTRRHAIHFPKNRPADFGNPGISEIAIGGSILTGRISPSRLIRETDCPILEKTVTGQKFRPTRLLLCSEQMNRYRGMEDCMELQLGQVSFLKASDHIVSFVEFEVLARNFEPRLWCFNA